MKLHQFIASISQSGLCYKVEEEIKWSQKSMKRLAASNLFELQISGTIKLNKKIICNFRQVVILLRRFIKLLLLYLCIWYFFPMQHSPSLSFPCYPFFRSLVLPINNFLSATISPVSILSVFIPREKYVHISRNNSY